MKKILCLFIYLSVFLLLSCSSDDTAINKIEGPVSEKILGKWYIESVIENGADINYIHKCADEKDYVLFESDDRFSRVYNSDSYTELKRDYVIHNYDNTITTSFFDPIATNQRSYQIIRLTDDELVLKTIYNEFSGEPETSYMYSYTR